MSTFLNSVKDELAAMEQQIQILPGELHSIASHLDRGKLRSLGFRLNQDFNKLLDKLFDAQRIRALLFPFLIQPSYPYIREITEEDLAKWRAAWKSDIRVVLGKEGVGVIAISELTKKYQATVSQVVLTLQQQGYIVLGWDEYQNLLDEVGSLIGEDKESLPRAIVGIPVTTTDTANVKTLPNGSPFLPLHTRLH